MSDDYRLMAVETLGDENLLLRERVADLEQDVLWYRAIAQSAIHALHHLVAERDQLQDALRRLVDAEREHRAVHARRPDPLLARVWRRRGALPPRESPRANEERIQ